MHEFQQPRLLLAKTQRLTLVVDGLDALVELLVEVDRVVLTRQHRVDLGLQGPELVVRLGARNVAECARHLGQQATRRFHREDRVLEGRRFRIRDDRVDFRTLFEDALLDRGHVMAVFDAAEGRHAVGRVPVLEERIAGEFLVSDHDLFRRSVSGGLHVLSLVLCATRAQCEGGERQDR